MTEISKVLDQDPDIKESLKGSKNNLSDMLNAEIVTKKGTKGFFAIAEDVAGFFVSNRPSNGTFAKGQISDQLSLLEDDWKNSVWQKPGLA